MSAQGTNRQERANYVECVDAESSTQSHKVMMPTKDDLQTMQQSKLPANSTKPVLNWQVKYQQVASK